MKKIILKIFLIISFIPIILIIFNAIKSYFYGYEIVMMSGLDIPLSFGFEAVYNYLWFMFSFTCLGMIIIPIITICIIYQVLYFYRRNKQNKGK